MKKQDEIYGAGFPKYEGDEQADRRSIITRIDDIEKGVTVIREALSQLADRVGPVLTEESDKISDSRSENRALNMGNSPLDSRLLAVHEDLLAIHTRILSLSGRVDF